MRKIEDGKEKRDREEVVSRITGMGEEIREIEIIKKN